MPTTRRPSVRLLALWAGLLALLPSPAPALQSESQQAIAAFRAASGGGLAERRAALERLVAVGDAEAAGVLATELGEVAAKLREQRDSLLRDRYALEHQRRVLELMKLQGQRDSTLGSALERQEKRVSELVSSVERTRARVEDLHAWSGSLCDGAGRMFQAMAPARRSKAEKDSATLAQGKGPLRDRLAAVELLGCVGSEGSALGLAQLLGALATERSKLQRELPKEMAELRKLEARWQKEQDQLEGRSSVATQQQYDRAKQRAAEIQSTLAQLAHLSDAIVDSGARALARESEPVFQNSLKQLARAQEKAEEAARRRILAMLAHSGRAAAWSELRARLSSEKEPGVRAAIIDALAAAGDAELAPVLLGAPLEDASWKVRSSAVAALARLRVRDAIPVLIERLEKEDGRLRSDVREALVSLTGQNFHGNVELWRRFWREQGEGFVVPEPREAPEASSEEAKQGLGITFFGIQSQSRRVLFVLDLSRSMTFSMVPRRSPNDEDPENPDMPQPGELSRLAVAKDALTRAIGGVEEGSVFNLVFYATDVWTWQDKLSVMNPATRSAALRYVEALDANGGTNIYGALQMALDLAGATTGKDWVKPEIDTIYFLSDGRPSVGVTTSPDEILAFVRERNAVAGITIHTIGLSGAQDAYLLRSLAEQNGGTYVAR